MCVVGASLLGYVVFHRNASSDDVSRTNRRGVSGHDHDDYDRDDQDFLKRPVYRKPPLDLNAPGEMGRAVKLDLEGEEKIKEEESIKKHQINTYVSDKISLHRRLPERWNPL